MYRIINHNLCSRSVYEGSELAVCILTTSHSNISPSLLLKFVILLLTRYGMWQVIYCYFHIVSSRVRLLNSTDLPCLDRSICIKRRSRTTRFLLHTMILPLLTSVTILAFFFQKGPFFWQYISHSRLSARKFSSYLFFESDYLDL